jgi:hypothetical protein
MRSNAICDGLAAIFVGRYHADIAKPLVYRHASDPEGLAARVSENKVLEKSRFKTVKFFCQIQISVQGVNENAAAQRARAMT